MAGDPAGLIAALDPRLAILAAAVPSLASGSWIFWQWWAKRSDEKETRELTREERRAQELDKLQATLSAETSSRVTELRQDLRDLRAELTETRRDRDRGWDLARWWHGAAHDLLRQFRHLRHNATNMQQWVMAAMRRYPDLGTPESLEPIPDRPDLPMGLEEPK